MRLTIIASTFLFQSILLLGQSTHKVERFPIGNTSTPSDSELKMTLSDRFQQYNWHPKSDHDNLDNSIFSPKSANFTPDGKKMYVQSLEGFRTSVYDMTKRERTKVIHHKFSLSNKALFKDDESTVFDYSYKYRNSNFNTFRGKPVESTLSHNGKYLWVTYYRRSYDQNAISPSAVAIIDTEKDSIVRVMPTGPLPKMIATSPDNKFVAITHWGDNTLGIVDISSPDVMEWKYTDHFVVGYRQKLNFKPGEKVNRDVNCGYCLRGTVFTPDSKYLLVGRMGGGGIAVFDMTSKEYLGTVFGMKSNIRHIAINNATVYVGCNKTGYVQKLPLADLIANKLEKPGENTTVEGWEGVYVGYGVRTIAVTSDDKYVFACVNGKNKIVAIRTSDMKVVASIGADSFPVGMDLSPDNKTLVVTSQGKAKKGGGNSVMVFDISY